MKLALSVFGFEWELDFHAKQNHDQTKLMKNLKKLKCLEDGTVVKVDQLQSRPNSKNSNHLQKLSLIHI